MKKFTKILCGVLGLGFVLTGCATVGNIKNSSDELILNGNSACVVDGYLYYGNALAENVSSWSKDSDYKSATKISYLARLNTNIELASKSQDYSPKCVEKVAGEVTSYDNNFMFVLGNYIYYATPNRQKVSADDGTSSYKFSYTTLYRSKLNGDNKEKIYTTNGDVSQIEVLKHGGKYYIVMLAGENLFKIQIGNKVSVTKLSEGVKSVALPKSSADEDSWDGYVYYTTDKKVEDYSDISGSVVSRVLIDGGESKQLFWKQGKTVSFVGSAFLHLQCNKPNRSLCFEHNF